MRTNIEAGMACWINGRCWYQPWVGRVVRTLRRSGPVLCEHVITGEILAVDGWICAVDWWAHEPLMFTPDTLTPIHGPDVQRMLDDEALHDDLVDKLRFTRAAEEA